MREHDIVRLIAARPDHGLLPGATGTIVHIFERPTRAFEVEFCDADGRTIAQFALTPAEIESASAHQTA